MRETKIVLSWIVAERYKIPSNVEHKKKSNEQAKISNELLSFITAPKIRIHNVGIHQLNGRRIEHDKTPKE